MGLLHATHDTDTSTDCPWLNLVCSISSKVAVPVQVFGALLYHVNRCLFAARPCVPRSMWGRDSLWVSFLRCMINSTFLLCVGNCQGSLLLSILARLESCFTLVGIVYGDPRLQQGCMRGSSAKGGCRLLAPSMSEATTRLVHGCCHCQLALVAYI